MSGSAPGLWLREVERSQSRPALAGELTADVAIVGGGLSGLWSAHAVLDRAPSASVVVVEAERVAWGASGRNGGWVSALFPVSWARVARDFDADVARTLRLRLVRNVDEIASFLADARTSVEWAHEGTLTVARTPPQWRSLVEELELFDELGLAEPPVLLDASGVGGYLRVEDALGGTFERACAAVHPAKLAELLATRLEARGGLVLERSRVHYHGAGVLLGSRGRVRAEQVIWATESYRAAEVRWHRDLVPVASQIIATAPLEREQLDRLGNPPAGLTFTDGRRLVVYGQIRADGRVVFGGRGAPYRFGSGLEFATEVRPTMQAALAAALDGFVRAGGPVTIDAAWGGTIGVARDWYPRVLHDPLERLTLVGGYAGDGVALSRLSGELAAAYAVGGATVGAGAATVARYQRGPRVDQDGRCARAQTVRWSARRSRARSLVG